MCSAPVGFQCPDCVKQGAKETRSGRTAYGGERVADATLTSKVLIGVNVAVWAAILFTGWQHSWLVPRLGLMPEGRCDAPRPGYLYRLGEQACTRVTDGTWVSGFATGAYWQPLTAAFTHVEIWHIALNMLALWSMGPRLEVLFGRRRFLALYLLSALSGSLAVCWLSSSGYSATVGASTALFGLLAAEVIVLLRMNTPLRALLPGLGFAVVISLIPGVSWQGHLGGFLGGLAVAAGLIYAPRGDRRATVQWLSIGVTAAAVLGGLAAFAATG